MAGDWNRLRAALNEARVSGTEDLGRFVSNTQYFRRSSFDERSAMPVLLRLLPTLKDRDAVTTVAGHLRRPWARPTAFPGLLEAFKIWAPKDASVGWALGDALATAADERHLSLLIDLVQHREYGMARAMVVYSLWRYRRDSRIEQVLLTLIEDPDVSVEAITALRRTLGNEAALPHLRRVQDSHGEPKIRQHAIRQVKRAETTSGRQVR